MNYSTQKPWTQKSCWFGGGGAGGGGSARRCGHDRQDNPQRQRGVEPELYYSISSTEEESASAGE